MTFRTRLPRVFGIPDRATRVHSRLTPALTRPGERRLAGVGLCGGAP